MPGLYLGSHPEDEDAFAHGPAAVICLSDRPSTSGAPGGRLYIHWPIKDGPNPDERSLKAISVLICSLIDAGHTVFVHCDAGLNRSALIVAAVLVARGLPSRDAIELVRAKRPGSLSDTYADLVSSLAKHGRSDRRAMVDTAGDPLELRPKFRGALLGAAIGDALGARYEGRPQVYPEQLRLLLTETSRRLIHTDDTAMTIGVAQSLLERDGFDGQHMAETFARNFRAEPLRGYGLGPPALFNWIECAVPWDVAAREQFNGHGSYGNGSAMRVAPAALFAYPSLDHVAKVAASTSFVTHSHQLGVEGGVMQALAVGCALGTNPGTPLDWNAIIAELDFTLEEWEEPPSQRVPPGTCRSLWPPEP